MLNSFLHTSTNSSWKTTIAPCTITAAGRYSAGVAIAVRNHIGMAYPAGWTAGGTFDTSFEMFSHMGIGIEPTIVFSWTLLLKTTGLGHIGIVFVYLEVV